MAQTELFRVLCKGESREHKVTPELVKTRETKNLAMSSLSSCLQKERLNEHGKTCKLLSLCDQDLGQEEGAAEQSKEPILEF